VKDMPAIDGLHTGQPCTLPFSTWNNLRRNSYWTKYPPPRVDVDANGEMLRFNRDR
jgi:hypothetical protein